MENIYKKKTLLTDTGIIYFILMVVFISLRLITSTIEISPLMANVINMLLQIVVMFGAPIVFLTSFRKQTFKKTFKDFKFKTITFKAVLLSIFVGILVYLLNIAVSSFFNTIVRMLGYDPSFGFISTSSSGPMSVSAFLLSVFLTAILPGICEETAHRGLLINGFKPLGAKKAILLSGLMFGLMHMNIEQCLYATIIGFFLGLVAIKTNSIYPCIIIHFMNNFINVFMEYLMSNGVVSNSSYTSLISKVSTGNIFVVLLYIMLALLVIIGLLVFVTYKLFKNTGIKSVGESDNEELKEFLKNEILKDETKIIPVSLSNTNNVDAQKMQSVKINFMSKSKIQTLIGGTEFMAYEYPKRKVLTSEKIFIYASIFATLVVNICTFVWGVM